MWDIDCINTSFNDIFTELIWRSLVRAPCSGKYVFLCPPAAEQMGRLVCPCPCIRSYVPTFLTWYLMLRGLDMDQAFTTDTTHKDQHLIMFSRSEFKDQGHKVLCTGVLLDDCLHNILRRCWWMWIKFIAHILRRKLCISEGFGGRGLKVKLTRWHSIVGYKTAYRGHKRFQGSSLLNLYSLSLLLSSSFLLFSLFFLLLNATEGR